MRVIKKADAVFKHSIDVDFSKNKRLLLSVNVISLLLFFVIFILFTFLTRLAGINNSDNIFFYYIEFSNLPSEYVFYFIAGLFATTFLHELIHGFFFFFFTKEFPRIGFKSVYAYAGSPDWYIKKNLYQIVSLSPFIILTLGGFTLLSFIHGEFAPVIFLLTAVNAAGCVGDFWMSIILINKPSGAYVNDTGILSTISY